MVCATAALPGGGGATGAQAQITIPTIVPPTSAPPGGGPPPSSPPPTDPVSNILKAPGTSAPAPPGRPAPPPPAPPTAIPGNLGGEGDAVPADAGPFPAELRAKMNSVRRSGARSSDQLVDALKALTDLGVPLDEAMRVGMGRFPIAGRTNFINDWWFPRFGPGWRLHEGTDLFAARNTPLRSPTTGTVRFSDGGLGGISVYITQSDGTYFYLTHLERRAEGLRPGQQVVTGDIVGYVGSSGNASGGSPHLHFEVHPAIKVVTVGKGKRAVTKVVSAPVRPGTILPPIDPKPLLDLYLQEALDRLPAIVAGYQANLPVPAVPDPAAAAGPAVPDSVVLASHKLSGGGLIVADAPLARTPLLGLAFLLIVMVVVLTPVLTPRRRLTTAPAIGRHAAEKRARRGSARRFAPTRTRTKTSGPGPAPARPPTGFGSTGGHTSANGAGVHANGKGVPTNGGGRGKGGGRISRLRPGRRRAPATPLVGADGRGPAA